MNDSNSSPSAGLPRNARTPGTTFRDYQAPQEDGVAVSYPSSGRVADLLDANLNRLDQHGEFWTSLRHDARAQLLADARRYTAAYRDVSWADGYDGSRILMAGHQPSLFHPGVWFKNFALDSLSLRTGTLAINLVVDNDITASHSIRVPALDPEHKILRYRAVHYDHGRGGIPFEQSGIEDRGCFERFDSAVTRAVQPLVADPSIVPLWEYAKAAIARCGIAGCALAQARHGLEGKLGLKTLEIPMGVVCRGKPFARFLMQILLELARFRDCYNTSAKTYRLAHGIRSTAHPVPNLGREDDWIEAPLWLYGNASPTRRGVWVRKEADRLVISDRAEREVTIDLRDEATAAEQLADAGSPEFKLRPRALLTTMYARMVLSDLFLHGIGGGKYDQLGDLIAEAFFNRKPPKFMVVSATLLLPGVVEGESADRVNRIKQALRDTRYRPERFAPEASFDERLLDRKAELIADIPPRGQKQQWHNEITAINDELAASLSRHRQELQRQLAAAQSQLASERVLRSREHPFCIYPLDYLTERYRAMLSD